MSSVATEDMSSVAREDMSSLAYRKVSSNLKHICSASKFCRIWELTYLIYYCRILCILQVFRSLPEPAGAFFFWKIMVSVCIYVYKRYPEFLTPRGPYIWTPCKEEFRVGKERNRNPSLLLSSLYFSNCRFANSGDKIYIYIYICIYIYIYIHAFLLGRGSARAIVSTRLLDKHPTTRQAPDY